MTEPRGHDCAELLAQADWVRALARHLTADAHAAEDLAQDALAAAQAVVGICSTIVLWRRADGESYRLKDATARKKRRTAS